MVGDFIRSGCLLTVRSLLFVLHPKGFLATRSLIILARLGQPQLFWHH